MTQPASIPLAQLVDHLDTRLRAHEGEDYCPNGLQVEGRSTVRRVVTAVSACQELFARAQQAEADAIVVHHGLFWHGASPVLTGVMGRRVRQLVESGISLLAYHLPLDRHEELGNNAVAAQRFGLVEVEPFAMHKGLPIGFKGRFSTPINAAALAQHATEIFAQAPLFFFDHGPQDITTLGLVSGGSQSYFHQAIDEGLDAYLTGEVTEWVMNLARETNTHYLACGHYATERLGVQAVGEHLANTFGLAVEYLDIPNPA